MSPIDISLLVLSIYLLYSIPVTLRGLRSLPRPDRPPAGSIRISAIIPARNEEGNVGDAIESLLRHLGPEDEVIVVDDASADGTFREAMEHCDGRCVLLRILTKPQDWSGKSWACYQGYLHSRGDVLLFMDADTRVVGDPREVLGLLSTHGAVSQVPRIVCDSLACGSVEVAFTSLLRLTYPYWENRDGKAWLAGAFMLWRRESYEAVGTHRSVRDSPVEDAELGRRAAELGVGTSFFLGRIAESSWISSWSEGYSTLRRILSARTPDFKRSLVISSVLVYASIMVYLAPVLAVLGAASPVLAALYAVSSLGYASLSLLVEVDASPLSVLLSPLGMILLSLALARTSTGAGFEWKGRRMGPGPGGVRVE